MTLKEMIWTVENDADAAEDARLPKIAKEKRRIADWLKRLQALEERVRWRSCIDEPPTQDGPYMTGSLDAVTVALYDTASRRWTSLYQGIALMPHYWQPLPLTPLECDLYND